MTLDAALHDLHLRVYMNLMLRSMIFICVSTWTWCYAWWSSPACLHELDAALHDLHFRVCMNLTLCPIIFNWGWGVVCIAPRLGRVCPLYVCRVYPRLFWRTAVFDFSRFSGFGVPLSFSSFRGFRVFGCSCSTGVFDFSRFSGFRVFGFSCSTGVFNFSRLSGFRVLVFDWSFRLFAVFGFWCSTVVFKFSRFSGFRVFVFYGSFRLFAVFGFSCSTVVFKFSRFSGFRVFVFYGSFRLFAVFGFSGSLAVFGFLGFRGDVLPITLFDFSGFRVFAPRPAPVTGNRRHTNPKHSIYIYIAHRKFPLILCYIIHSTYKYRLSALRFLIKFAEYKKTEDWKVPVCRN